MCCFSNPPTAIACIPDDDDGVALARIISETYARRGKVIIPAFAIGRVEELLYWLFKLEDERRLPEMPIYVDSPMAIKGIAYYQARKDELDKEIEAVRRKLPRFTPINSGLESKALVETDRPGIIIASSGMATGGRVVHHLFAGLPDPRNTVLFVGFQAAGTRGRQLVDGAQHVKIFGQHVPVHARIEKLDGMSAACRCGGDHPVAAHVPARAEDDLSRSRRSRGPGRTAAAHRQGAWLAGPCAGARGEGRRRSMRSERDPGGRPRHQTRGRICSSKSTMRPSCSCMRTASRSCR